MTIQELIDKISTLIAQRENFLTQANLTVGNFNGQIQVYQTLLEDLKRQTAAGVGSTENKPGNETMPDGSNAALPLPDALKTVLENGDVHA